MSKTSLICLCCLFFIEQDTRLAQENVVNSFKEHLEDQPFTTIIIYLYLKGVNMHLL